MSAIERLQHWVASQCDGDWEHGSGLRLEMLDNPGWRLTVDLSSTELASFAPGRVSEQRSEIDWIEIEIDPTTFVGCGGVGNLGEIIERFLSLVAPDDGPTPDMSVLPPSSKLDQT